MEEMDSDYLTWITAIQFKIISPIVGSITETAEQAARCARNVRNERGKNREQVTSW